MTRPSTVAGSRLRRAARLVTVIALVTGPVGCTPSAPETAPPSLPTAAPTDRPSGTPSSEPSPPSPSASPTPASSPIADWAGRTWERHEVTEVDDERILQLFLPTAANGRYLATIDGQSMQGWWRLVYSDDGRTWHFARVPDEIRTEIRPMAYGDRHWLALTYRRGLEEYFSLSSTDGRTWDWVRGAPLVIGDGSTESEAAAWPRDLVWHRGAWYVLISQPKRDTEMLYRSETGADWSVVTTFPAEAAPTVAMESDGGTLVIVQVGIADGGHGPAAWASTDGVTWIRQSLPTTSDQSRVWDVQAARGRWIAIGGDEGTAAWWSADGERWSEAEIDGTLQDGFRFPAVALADGFLALPIQEEIPWASADGRRWAPVTGFETDPRAFALAAAAETRGLTLITGRRVPPPDPDPPVVPVVWLGSGAP